MLSFCGLIRYILAMWHIAFTGFVWRTPWCIRWFWIYVLKWLHLRVIRLTKRQAVLLETVKSKFGHVCEQSGKADGSRTGPVPSPRMV